MRRWLVMAGGLGLLLSFFELWQAATDDHLQALARAHPGQEEVQLRPRASLRALEDVALRPHAVLRQAPGALWRGVTWAGVSTAAAAREVVATAWRFYRGTRPAAAQEPVTDPTESRR
ncbi:MAG: hypothetical protein HYV08_01225 [Deltaproteobacteria bacterium]|nr:hypothetical protein [Deltaproteobacteria bacterium]MBI3078973.1 hypothetical protein [Deltaproteobacteria bacterium]